MIATVNEYEQACEELRSLEERLARLQQSSSPGEKGLTKAGVRKLIARLHEDSPSMKGPRNPVGLTRDDRVT